MSYQVLARKYRPKSFETLVGQEHVVRALSHALEHQRLHHAYLFTGTRGVGKTTLSRILAKSFNCETGITARPCGVCGTCTAIDAGRFVDYIEMDAASNRGVDEMAALLEQAIYAPSNARFKVYMIDEVHMLTNHAFNAMLKTLEEPPEHVKFILATTDPQKIPMTVLSRCLQFNLKLMPPGHIVSHLENILGQEQIAFDVPALRLLAHGAHGSMRDALSLTDQAIAYAAGKVTLDAVQGMLGALDQSFLIRLLDALAIKDGKALLDVADEMAARSLSYKTALQDIGSLLHQIAIAQMVPNAVSSELPEYAEVMRLSELFGKEEVQLYYQIAVHGRNELALAPDEYAGFSMSLLRMLAFRPVDGADSQSNNGGGGGHTPQPRPTLPPPVRSAPALNVNVNVSAQKIHTPALASPAPILLSMPIPEVIAPSVAAAAMPAAPVVEASAKSSMSPAMAALAAARAGSNKAAGGRATVQPLARAPLAEVAVVRSAPAPLQAGMAAQSPAQMPAPTQESQAQRTSAKPQVQVEPEYGSMSMDDMPPPWDEDLMMPPSIVNPSYAQTRATSVIERIAESEYIANEPELALLDPVPAVTATPVAAPVLAQAAPTLAEPIVGARALVIAPIAKINWDGHWPNLAASLPVRGVAQQLAQQSELIQCEINGNAVVFSLRVPIPTLLSSGSVDKLIAALTERFNYAIRVETVIGAVEQTANAHAVAERAVRQQQAENSIQNDSFIQTLMREFGASIVTGSIKPI